MGLVVFLAAPAPFLQLGAQKVFVAEGPGHRRDTFLVLEESGLADVLYEDRIPFFNLNDTEVYNVPNAGGKTALKTLTFSRLFKEVDWVVSLPKLKTHHWTGVTLAMKNLFGVMPGICYGWPKNYSSLLSVVQDDKNLYLKCRGSHETWQLPINH